MARSVRLTPAQMRLLDAVIPMQLAWRQGGHEIGCPAPHGLRRVQITKNALIRKGVMDDRETITDAGHQLWKKKAAKRAHTQDIP